jgi:predicted GIY-YIG superfamily endonuclease
MPLYLYLISHDRPEIKTHTYIGCTENFLKRLNQHNGLEAGGPRITKRAAGSWEPVIIIKIQDDSTLNSKDLKKEWKQSSRGLESRIRRGLEIAVNNQLQLVMPKNKNNNIPIVKFINDNWDGDTVNMTNQQWKRVLSSEL